MESLPLRPPNRRGRAVRPPTAGRGAVRCDLPRRVRAGSRRASVGHARARGGAGPLGWRHAERERRPHVGAAVAGGLVSRVLSRVPRKGNARLAIYLGRASPRASSGQPGDVGEPGRLSLPIGPCTGWGLPSCPCCQGHWCALTAPFHPYVRRSAGDRRARSAFCCTCRRLTRPAVSWHPALRCPDFPRPCGP